MFLVCSMGEYRFIRLEQKRGNTRVMFSLRIKMLLAVGLLVVIVLGTSTFVHIRTLNNNYLEALEWRSKALAQGILNDIVTWGGNLTPQNIQSALQGSAFLCRSTYEQNKDDWITHIAVIDEAGNIAAHNDRNMQGLSIESALLREKLRQQTQMSVLDGDAYHTFLPIFGAEDVYMGTIDIGTAKILVDKKIQQVLVDSVVLFVIFLVVTVVSIGVLMQLLFISPMKRLVATGQQFAQGNLAAIESFSFQKDEIGIIGSVFQRIGQYLQGIAATASHIATGALGDDVQVRSEQDILGKAFRAMLAYLGQVADVMKRIAEGDLTFEAQPRSSQDAFGRAIQHMTDGLRSLIRQIRSSSKQIAATGETIASLAERDIRIVQNVTYSVENMVSTMNQMGASMEEVTRNMDALTSSVEETSTSISQMTFSIRHIAANTGTLKEQTDQTITFLNETVGSLEDVVNGVDLSQQLSLQTSQNALEVQQAVELVINSMHTIHQTVTTAVEAIHQFSTRSQDIDSILAVIRNITDQTSLLALNASIIAAQAGIHGRGFAVVADEIKSLAAGVGTSTKDIAAIVQTLKQDTQNIVETIHNGASSVEQGIKHTQQAQKTLESILESADHSSSVVTEIAGTLHALMMKSRKVSDAMKQVELMTDDITRATNEQKITTGQIDLAIGMVNDMAAQISLAIREQARGIHQVLSVTEEVMKIILQNQESSQHITQTSEQLSSQADLLLQEVERFRITDKCSSDMCTHPHL